METELAEPPVYTVDLDRLVSSRLLITASSGGGKSRTIRSLVERTHGRIQQIVFDPEGEFGSLREKYPFLLAGAEGEVPTTVETARLLCRRVMELGVSVVIDLYDLPLSQRRAYVRLFLDELMHLGRDMWRPLMVVMDEGHLFAPERGTGEAECLDAVIALASQGRKRGYSLVLATQRLSKLHKDVAAELLNKMVGRTFLDVDVARAGDDLGMDKATRRTLKQLSPGTFYAVGPALGDGAVHLVRSGDILTTHPEPGKIAPPPPPTPEAIRALAAQFADIPQEADAEAQTIETLRRQLKEARETGQKNLFPVVPERVIERVVERRVEVPVITDEQVEEIRLLIETAHGLSDTLLQKGQEMLETSGDLKTLGQTLQTALDKAQRAAPPPAPAQHDAAPDSEEQDDVAEPVTAPVAAAESVEFRGLNAPARRILKTLAVYRGAQIERDTLALLADFTPTGGAAKAALRVLRENNWITTDRGASYAATESGQAVAGVNDSQSMEKATAAIMGLWRPVLGPMLNGSDALHLLHLLVAQRLLRFHDNAVPSGINGPELAGRAGFTVGMRFDVAIGLLTKHDLIYKEGRQYIAAATFFPLME